MIRTIHIILLLFVYTFVNAQVNPTNLTCSSTFPSDSIAFDTTFFTKVNNVTYGINQQENSWSAAFDNNNFASATICQNPDLYVDLTTSKLYVGQYNKYEITFGNHGMMSADDAILKIDFGQNIVPLSASLLWDSKNGTTYTWNLGRIETLEEFTIYIEDSVSRAANDGDFLSVTATIIDNVLIDCNSSNNIANNSTITTTIEANTIEVTPEGLIDTDDKLTYTIRFQNLQNGLIDGIIVRNNLPETLDLSTLERGETSHPHEFRIEGHTLVWEFEKADLSNTMMYGNDSHGFITFKVLPQENLEVGTEIKNQAAVIFNHSNSILTNTVTNVIDKSGALAPGELGICPNPTADYAIIFLDSEDNEEIQDVNIYTKLGVRVLSYHDLSGEKLRIEGGVLPAAYYIVQVKSNKGNIYTGKLLVNE